LSKRQCHRARLRIADGFDSAQEDGSAISHEKVRLAGDKGVPGLAFRRFVRGYCDAHAECSVTLDADGDQLTRLDRLGEPFVDPLFSCVVPVDVSEG